MMSKCEKNCYSVEFWPKLHCGVWGTFPKKIEQAYSRDFRKNQKSLDGLRCYKKNESFAFNFWVNYGKKWREIALWMRLPTYLRRIFLECCRIAIRHQSRWGYCETVGCRGSSRRGLGWLWGSWCRPLPSQPVPKELFADFGSSRRGNWSFLQCQTNPPPSYTELKNENK